MSVRGKPGKESVLNKIAKEKIQKVLDQFEDKGDTNDDRASRVVPTGMFFHIRKYS